jgi:hypothetical protein
MLQLLGQDVERDEDAAVRADEQHRTGRERRIVPRSSGGRLLGRPRLVLKRHHLLTEHSGHGRFREDLDTRSAHPPSATIGSSGLSIGGRTGIRTLEGLSPLTVFKTVAFVRSATLPA